MRISLGISLGVSARVSVGMSVSGSVGVDTHRFVHMGVSVATVDASMGVSVVTVDASVGVSVGARVDARLGACMVAHVGVSLACVGMGVHSVCVCTFVY